MGMMGLMDGNHGKMGDAHARGDCPYGGQAGDRATKVDEFESK
jgi:hypothetical protein